LQRFESLLLTPATILGTPTEAGLNQKNSTSLSLGTQTAFDFLRPASAGVFVPKCSMNLVLNFVTYLWDTTLEVVSKPHQVIGILIIYMDCHTPVWAPKTALL
jgi:hypothetical protein